MPNVRQTIKQAYRDEPLLTVLTLAIAGIAGAIAILASLIFAPNLLEDPLGNPTASAVDLLQVATFLLMVACAFAIFVDRKKGSERARPFGQPPRQPKRIRIALGLEWTLIRNGQTVNRRMMMMAV